MGLNKRIFTDLREFENEVVEGEVNPLESWSELLELEKLITKTKEAIKPIAITELQKYDKYERNGKSFTVSQKTNYDLSGCKFYQNLNSQLKQVKELSVMAAKTGKSIIDENTGEVIEPAIITYSEPFITVK